MAYLKWFEKVDAAIARADADRDSHVPLDAFDFDCLIEKSWISQQFWRWLRRSAIPALAALFRWVWPVARFGRVVVITRHADVLAVLENENGAFPVVYGPEMKQLGGGTQGVLGMDGAEHGCLRARISNQLRDEMLLPGDLEKLGRWSRETANALLDAGGGEIDVCRDLITRTATEVCCRYMGLDPADPDAFGEWSMALSMLLFGDWSGDEKIGRQGRIGAAHLLALVDDGIDRVQMNARRHAWAEKSAAEQRQFRLEGSLIYRLLVIEGLSPELVRATIVGLATGFVPTNTLAAGNILEELLARPRLMRRAQDAAKALAAVRQTGGEEAPALAALEAVLLEAGRRNPALSPGVWRHCPDGGTFRRDNGRDHAVPPGSLLMVSILSALRDERRPAEADPRKAASLIFGHGPHGCLGADMALVQITEVFAALLARPDVALNKGKAGRMVRAGPFPVRCSMTWRDDTARRSLMVIAVPVRAGVSIAQVEAELDRIGNPMQPAFAATLTGTGCIGFASINVIETGPDCPDPILLVEINGDGPDRLVLEKLVGAAHDWLAPVLRLCVAEGATMTRAAMVDLLEQGIHDLHRYPWGSTGLHFDGARELSVTDIARQQRLASVARGLIDEYLVNLRNFGSGTRAMDVLRRVRRNIKGDWLTELRAPNATLHRAIDKDVRLGVVRPSLKRLEIADWQPPQSNWGPLWQMLRGPDARLLVRSFLATWAVTGLSLLAWLRPGAWRGLLALGASAWAQIVALKDGLVAALLAAGSWGQWWWGLLVWLGRLAGAVLGAIWRTICIALTHGWDIATVVFGGLASALILFGLAAAGFALMIRRLEKGDLADDRNPSFAAMERIAALENPPGCEQNHIIALMPFKPGLTRRFSFALVMWGIKQLISYWFRPGYVVTMGTIHKARWFRVKGTRQFVFFASYDGSWESYLEDFITRAHQGQSAAWSHGVGFPGTSFLVFDGARDGDRFKRWVRRQQRPSLVWYSRFPELTLKQMHLNAMIEDGLARAASDTDARRWLSFFGSAQGMPNELEETQTQSIVFSGFGDKAFATTLLIRLPQDPRKLAWWLNRVALGRYRKDEPLLPGQVSFGDAARPGPALVLGFTAAGLERAGLGEGKGAEELPAAFRMGMRARARILGDAAGTDWRWQDGTAADGRTVEAVLQIYHEAPPQEGEAGAWNDAVWRHWQALEAAGGAVVHAVPCQPVVLDGVERRGFEHFGFRDGISQPVIRGTRRSLKGVPERDVVSPGEFLLGYRNDQGYVSPSITIGSQLDPANNLPTMAESRPNRFPFFGNRTSATERHDFGRNGTFLVLRQLDQDVDGFREELANQVGAIHQHYPELPDVVAGKVDADWLAARIIGRWKDGTALVRSAQPRPPGQADPDNDFAYGTDDPRGLACPLGAHIRRTNPRDSLEPGDREEQQITNRHRLLRRGRSYAYVPDESGETKKGLLFAALCADLDRQFEFVQGNWINARSFHGLTDEADPLLGHPGASMGKFLNPAGATGSAHETRFTIPTTGGPVVVKGLQSHVSVHGGGYFFLPARAAIQHLVARLYADNPAD